MTEKEIMEWRQKVIIDRLYFHLGKLGISRSKIRMAEISIYFDEKKVPSTKGIKVFLGDYMEPEIIEGNDFIFLIIRKLTRILGDLGGDVNAIKIIAGPEEAYRYEVLF